MYRVRWIFPLVLLLSGRCSFAVEVGVDFTGTANAFFSVFGVSGAGLPVTGTFFYETSTIPSTSSLICSGVGCENYEQDRVNGFTININGVEISADNYIVKVMDDAIISGTTRDSLAIVWRHDLTPALDPLKVNGVDQTTGQFRIDLTGVDSLFNSASLPSSLNWSDFNSLSPPALLSDSISLPKVFISLSSLTVHPPSQSSNDNLVVPEPATLLQIFCVLSLVFLKRFNRSG